LNFHEKNFPFFPFDKKIFKSLQKNSSSFPTPPNNKKQAPFPFILPDPSGTNILTKIYNVKNKI